MTEKKPAIRLNHLTIKNYKKIDFLEIDFPKPLMKGDADILVFGSKNGGGKTSVLECCALLVLAGVLGKKFDLLEKHLPNIVNIVVKAGEKEAVIEGEFTNNDKKCTLYLILHRGCRVIPLYKGDNLFEWSDDTTELNNVDGSDYFADSIFSFSTEPLIIQSLLYFNSYRKIQESKIELGMMTDDYSSWLRIRNRNLISSFKLEILRALMGKAALFESFKQDDSETVLNQLNNLMQRYCSGRIESLRPLPDNKVDIRIKPVNGAESFSFDGLSSGQKEMIATLFLIWKNTKDQFSIVLIDEPELHLNAEWQSDFIQQLHQLAPHNQYILATHSKEIFRSVDKGYRAILESDEKGIE